MNYVVECDSFGFFFFADTTCTLWSQNQSVCLLHDSRDFGNIVNIYSAALALIAVILELIILFVTKDLQLYGIEAFSEIPAVEMQTISRRHTEEPDGKWNFVSIEIEIDSKSQSNKKSKFSFFFIKQAQLLLNPINHYFLAMKMCSSSSHHRNKLNINKIYRRQFHHQSNKQ